MINSIIQKDVPDSLTITEVEAERLCCAILQWRNCNGLYANWGGEIMQYIMGCFQTGKDVTFKIN